MFVCARAGRRARRWSVLAERATQVLEVTPLSWQDRIDALRKVSCAAVVRRAAAVIACQDTTARFAQSNNWLEALELALDYYEVPSALACCARRGPEALRRGAVLCRTQGKAKGAAISPQEQKQLSDYIVSLLLEYVELYLK